MLQEPDVLCFPLNILAEAEESPVTSGNGLIAKPRAWTWSWELLVEDRWPPRSCCSLDNGNEEGEMLRAGIKVAAAVPGWERAISEMFWS